MSDMTWPEYLRLNAAGPPAAWPIRPEAKFETVMEVLADSNSKVLKFTCPFCDRVLEAEDAQRWLEGDSFCICHDSKFAAFDTMRDVLDAEELGI